MAYIGLLSQDSARDITDRLLEWHDEAKRAGRHARAGALLDLAWCSYDFGPYAFPPLSAGAVIDSVTMFDSAA